jgi:hypothetical protein
MPRFFFDFASGKDHWRDDEGTVLPNVASAKEEAGQIAGGWIKDNVRDAGAEMTLTVRDGSAEAVFKLSASITFSTLK